MSKVESVNLCSICDLAFETRKQFIKHNLSDEHLNSARKKLEYENMEGCMTQKNNITSSDLKITLNILLKPNTKPKTKFDDSIYSGIKYECKDSHAEFRSKIALTTHSYSHNRTYLKNTEYFDIIYSQKLKELYMCDKAGDKIEDIDENIKTF